MKRENSFSTHQIIPIQLFLSNTKEMSSVSISNPSHHHPLPSHSFLVFLFVPFASLFHSLFRVRPRWLSVSLLCYHHLPTPIIHHPPSLPASHFAVGRLPWPSPCLLDGDESLRGTSIGIWRCVICIITINLAVHSSTV